MTTMITTWNNIISTLKFICLKQIMKHKSVLGPFFWKVYRANKKLWSLFTLPEKEVQKKGTLYVRFRKQRNVLEVISFHATLTEAREERAKHKLPPNWEKSVPMGVDGIRSLSVNPNGSIHSQMVEIFAQIQHDKSKRDWVDSYPSS